MIPKVNSWVVVLNGDGQRVMQMEDSEMESSYPSP